MLSGRLITVDGTAGVVREGVLQLTAWPETDAPDLDELAELARRVSPIRAHTCGDHPALDDNSAVRFAMRWPPGSATSSRPTL
jgi:pyruvate, orthophosphate dikinase